MQTGFNNRLIDLRGNLTQILKCDALIEDDHWRDIYTRRPRTHLTG